MQERQREKEIVCVRVCVCGENNLKSLDHSIVMIMKETVSAY